MFGISGTVIKRVAKGFVVAGTKLLNFALLWTMLLAGGIAGYYKGQNACYVLIIGNMQQAVQLSIEKESPNAKTGNKAGH